MNDNLLPNVPGIAREAESPELEQLAYRAAAALEAASAGGKTYLDRMKEAGDFLSEARKTCGVGNWINWLKSHNISRSNAFRAIKAFTSCSRLEHLSEALSDLAVPGEEQETAPPALPDQSLVYCGRNCRVGLGPSKCKLCAKARHDAKKAAEEEARKSRPVLTPEQIKALKLAEVLAEGACQLRLASNFLGLSKKIRKIERTNRYRAQSGDREETAAEFLFNKWKELKLTAVTEACKACGGDVDPPPDADPCEDCGGRGVLTEAEALAIKERVNF